MDAVTYLHLPPDTPPPDLTIDPFVAVIVADKAVGEEWRGMVCDWLVGGGCLYAVAWGRECEVWHDRMDEANIAAFVGRDIPGDKLVMTTWHHDKPLSEALWFASWAEHPTIDLKHVLIVHIAPDERKAELLNAFQVARAE
jgi:hypothetical protein